MPQATIIPTPTQRVSKPVILTIPKLGIEANVEEVGQDKDGKMDVPKTWQDIGWYDLGYKPGEEGSAVIDGHFDTISGSPAVFYYLNSLNKGDEVKITSGDGKQYTFKVTSSQIYDFDKLPLEQIFASNDKPRLNLVTCNGTWDQNSKNYSKRLVVYAELE